MSRKGLKEKLARAAEEKSGTYDEMITSATRPSAPHRASVDWATPRPPEREHRQRKGGRSAAKVTPLVAVPTAGEELVRLFDQSTVESIYDVIDLILPKLHPKDQNVYLQLFRRTHAIGQRRCIISFAELARLVNVGISGATYSVQRLEGSMPPFVERTGRRLGKGKQQGVEIEVFIPKMF
jgi:hypothetical protein